LSNITQSSYGKATIGGIDVRSNPVIGYCPQFDALSQILTAKDILYLIGNLNGFENVEERVQMVLECVMMEDHANKLVKKCSGGQKRRISIAVCLMSGASFLMLDEPTGIH
jgi:ABC-type multidrug transport system ATPase subunit